MPWPLAIACAHAQLTLAENYDPLPAAFVSLGPPLALFSFVAGQDLAAWALLFLFAGLLPFIVRGVHPRNAALVTALIAVAVSLVVNRNPASDYLPFALIAAGYLALALCGKCRGRETGWFYRRAPAALAGLTAIAFVILWTAHFGLRDWGTEAPWGLLSIWLAAAATAIFLLLRRAPNRWVSLAALATSLAFLWPQVRSLLSENYRSVDYTPPVGRNISPRHIILIVVDTLRADALSFRSPDAPPTPHLDALAAESIVFENAISAAPWTVPAVMSLMTGFAPFQEALDTAYETIPLPTLADRLAEHGYHTRAIVANHLLYRPHSSARGFHRIETFATRPTGDSRAAANLAHFFPKQFLQGGSTKWITGEALRWAGTAQRQPSFLWLHYFDPHDPYLPPARYLPPGVNETLRPEALTERDSDPELPKRLYSAEVSFVDDELGRFFQRLKDAGIYDDALIILTSDHGEEFWEHGGTRHGSKLYQELLHVPLLIRLPGAKVRRTVKCFVPTQALMPTVLDLTGVPYEPQPGWAPSLAPLTVKDRPEEYVWPIVSGATLYDEFQWAVVFEGMKYIQRLHSGREELYDLDADPREESSVLEQRPADAAVGRQILRRHRVQADMLMAKHGPPRRGDLRELTRRLRSMGYVR